MKRLKLREVSHEEINKNEPRFLVYNKLTNEWEVKTKSGICDMEDQDVGTIYELQECDDKLQFGIIYDR